jgi:hypothetical protein
MSELFMQTLQSVKSQFKQEENSSSNLRVSVVSLQVVGIIISIISIIIINT